MTGLARVLPLPVPARRPWIEVTSPFGTRPRPVGAIGEPQMHTGVDLRAAVGTPIIAIGGGRITRIDVDGVGKGAINGNAVFLSSGGCLICYLHLSRVGCAIGDVVIPGQELGATGATGRATGPHLHFQVYGPDRQVLDPATLYPADWLRPAV